MSIIALALTLPLSYHAPAHLPRAAAASSRRAVRLSEAEEAARRRWLERSGEARAGGAPRPSTSAEEAIQAQQREREENRKRMLAVMGDSAELRRGAGEAFGFGGQDDEDYFGQDKWRHRRPVGETDLLTGKPLNEYERPGTSFGGRSKGWRRRVEAVDPSGPRPENTLRAPGPSIPVQHFEYDMTPDAATQRAADEFRRQEEARRAEERQAAALQQQEEDLLAGLQGLMGTDEGATRDPS